LPSASSMNTGASVIAWAAILAARLHRAERSS
jgi:hypothetical protein